MFENEIKLIDEFLISSIPAAPDDLKALPEMLSYSLEGGGKRVRPLLCLLFARAAGGSDTGALPFCAATEFVHTYSLIHDDLPCMDNDDYRRGKLSSHKKFGEANALLAGDALLTHAFGILSDYSEKGVISAEKAIKATGELSRLAGINGMIGGQYIDLESEGKSCDGEILFRMDSLKTSALIEAASVLGLISAGADDSLIAEARNYALNLGLAFQITDDVIELDDGEENGDVINQKMTYPGMYGIDGAKALAAEYTAKAMNALNAFDNYPPLVKLTSLLLERKK